jgi:hypothetical protein
MRLNSIQSFAFSLTPMLEHCANTIRSGSASRTYGKKFSIPREPAEEFCI